MVWQLQPIEYYHIRDYKDAGGSTSFDLENGGQWWYWDTGVYSADEQRSLEPIVGQVYHIIGKQRQIFKVTRVERISHYTFVQVDWLIVEKLEG